MHSQLLKILRQKEREVDRLKKEGGLTHRDLEPLPRRDFKAAISIPEKIRLIAEIKFASPSEGIIRRDGNPIHARGI